MGKVPRYRDQINGKEFLIESSTLPDVQLCHSGGLSNISSDDLSKNLWDEWSGEESD